MKDIIQLKSFSFKLNNILIRDHSGHRPLKPRETATVYNIIVSFTDADFVRGIENKEKKPEKVRAYGISTYTKRDINKYLFRAYEIDVEVD